MCELEKRVKHTISWIDSNRSFTTEPYSPRSTTGSAHEEAHGVLGAKPLISRFFALDRKIIAAALPIHRRFITRCYPNTP